MSYLTRLSKDYTLECTISMADLERRVSRISDQEEAWYMDTPKGPIYGFDSKEPGGMWHRRIWLPTDTLPVVNSRTLREAFGNYLSINDVAPLTATVGLQGEPQVMLERRIVRPNILVRELTAPVETTIPHTLMERLEV